MFINFIKFKKS